MHLISAIALLGSLSTVLSHNIQMGAHKKECFHEQLHKDDKMTVTFQVGDREFGGAGNLEVDFWVSLKCALSPEVNCLSALGECIASLIYFILP